MKTQILIEDGRSQIIFTPETAFEKAALSEIKDGDTAVTVRRGQFSENQAGYIREFQSSGKEQSVMLCFSPRSAPKVEGA